MPIAKNTYKGMNQDTSKTLHSPEFYYEGRDIRVVTDDGLSTGDIENEKGNTYIFRIPTVHKLIGTSAPTGANIIPGSFGITATLGTGNAFYFNTTFFVEPASGTIDDFFKAFKDWLLSDPGFAALDLQVFLVSGGAMVYSADPEHNITQIADPLNRYDIESITSTIIGKGNIREDIYLFSCLASTYEPLKEDNPSFIWKFLYDQSETNIFTPTIRLVYGGNLGFSKEYPIGDEVEGRYESPNIQKIYWVDGKHPIRFLNVAVNNELVSENNLESSPVLETSEIIINSVDSGGSLETGQVQYGYQLGNSQGALTSLSPLSSLVHLTSSQEGSPTNEYFGEPAGKNSGKSVNISVSNLDTEFNIIQLYRIHYKDEFNTPTINIISQNTIINGTTSFTDTGNENLGSLTLSEFTSLINVGLISKTIAVKDDRLFQANIEEETFEIDFDARAYRFNSPSRVAFLHKADGSTLEHTISGTLPTPNWPTDETLDAFNVYNRNFSDSVVPGIKYIYQADGTTIGGQGPNVSYKIETNNQCRLDNDNNSGYPAGGAGGAGIPTKQQRRIKVQNTGNTSLHPNNPYIDNYASPIIDGDRRGYKRGEVYRFGLKFVAKTGISSFVKWIGDIKMPTCADGPNFAISERAISGGDTLGRILYVNFQIDLTTLSPEQVELIDYVEIVRIERKEQDKTILAQGLVNNTIRYIDTSSETHNRIQPFAPSIYEMLNNGVNSEFSGTTALAAQNNTIVEFISPEYLISDSLRFLDGDFLRYQCIMTDWTRNVAIFDTDPIGDANFTERRGENRIFGQVTPDLNTSIVSKGRNSSTSTDDSQVDIQTQIENYTPIIAGAGLSNNIGNIFLENIVDFSGGSITTMSSGIEARGNSKVLLNLDRPITDTNWMGFTPLKWTTNQDGFVIADYKRERLAQYGGASFESRSINTYISTGERITVSSNSIFGIDTYGGDTFIAYFDYLRCSINDVDPISLKYYQEILLFPLETSVNLELRHDRAFTDLAKDYNDIYLPLQESLDYSKAQPNIGTEPLPNLPENATDLYLYNETYSRELEVIKSFPKPLFSNFSKVFDTTTKYSQVKFDNETFDSWTKFLTNSINNVDNKYGPITKLISFKDEILFIQETGFGKWSINPRVQTQASDGQSIELGVGKTLDDYIYISTKFGTNQKFGIISSEQNLYFLDPRTNKLIKTGQGNGSLSDVLGMYSFFKKNLSKELRDNSNPFIGSGITTIFDRKFNEVLFTVKQQDNSYTVGFNELTNTFTGLYSYAPSMYIEDSKNLFSIGPNNLETYVHHFGNHGVYYTRDFVTPIPVTSSVTIIINPQADVSKFFDICELYSQVYDAAGNEIQDETISSVRFYNDYQDTGTITLTNNVNLRKRFRKWRWNIFRDGKARLKNPYLFVTLNFENNNNKRLVLHHLITSFRLRPF